MIRYFLLRIVLPLVLFLLVRSVLQSIFKTARGTSVKERPPDVPAGGELKRDPVCGTYVAVNPGLSISAKGQTYYFCSKECRDRYRAA
jgi:YHS domain-containing protein